MSVESGTTARLSLTKLTRMLNIRHRDYGKVEDMLDTRVPLHNEEAFLHGIKLKAKFIGSLEIAKPSGKMDIITAMRKIRYEFKSKGIKKVRAQLEISTAGVKVIKRKRMRRKTYAEAELLIMQHPIYRIFYVSHDSQDLKIFSYITREVADNTFRCNVFKAYKNSMALHIVRSLGQAFEVCHKINARPPAKKKSEEESGKTGEEEGNKTEEAKDSQKVTDANQSEDKGPVQEGVVETVKTEGVVTTSAMVTGNTSNVNKDLLEFDPFSPLFPNNVPDDQPTLSVPPFTIHNAPPLQPYLSRPRPRPNPQQTVIQENPFAEPPKDGRHSPTISLGEPLGMDLTKTANPFVSEGTDGAAVPPSLWEMEKQQLCAQLALLEQQLQTETTARMEAQAQVSHLLAQNKELLGHMQKLIVQIQQLKAAQTNSSPAFPTAAGPTAVPTAIAAGPTAVPIAIAAGPTAVPVAIAAGPTEAPAAVLLT